MENLIYILLFILIILVIILIVLVIKNKPNKNENELYHQLNQDLYTFQNGLTNAIRNDMNNLNENTSNKLLNVTSSVNESLNQSYKNTNEAINVILKQMSHIDESQEQLKYLGKDITALHNILNDKKSRGSYGEIELYSILDNTFGENSKLYAKQYQLSNHLVVDAVVFGNDSLGIVPIDSKFPLENYNRIIDVEINRSEKMSAINAFKNDLKKHINDIHNKYLIEGETSEFALMFIPAEAIFAYIYGNLDDIINYSYQNKVYLVSPTTLMAYITSIKALYLDQKKNDRIKDIQNELIDLSKQFNNFKVRYEKVQKDINTTNKDMKDVLISAEKIEKRFKRIENVEFRENED